MIALDTNVLVRLVVEDASNLQQVQAARAAVVEQDVLYVSLPALLESVWVLRSVFRLNRDEQQRFVRQLLDNQAFALAAEAVVRAAFVRWCDSKIDFGDALIWADAREQELELLSFDVSLLRQAHVISP